MQFWPRSQTKRVIARVRCWAVPKEAKAKLLGFAGYKVGMTHALIIDNRKSSLTKGEEIFCPVTIIECPPIKTASIRFYKKTINGSKLISEVFAENLDKELNRKITLPKSKKSKTPRSKASGTTKVVSEHTQKQKVFDDSKNFQNKIKKKIEDIKDYDDIRLLVYTQPKLTGIGKKKPELFELGISGKKEDKLNYAKNILGKEVNIQDIFKEGQQLDFHVITKGKGFQGPVKRFGIGLKAHKSEKSRRGPGSLGGWKGQGHFMYRIAHAGRMGYNQRIEYNKWLLKMGAKAEEVNPKSGFAHYGLIRNPYIFVKGSIGGPVKRVVKMTYPIRPTNKIPSEAPSIQYISLKSS